MKHINRLLQAARKAAYTATGSIWNGVKGAGVERFYSEHSTAEEAESACNALQDKYPEAEIVVFVDSVEE